jgi:PPK2 family polyphosphate:nucleotide phosphotransferase
MKEIQLDKIDTRAPGSWDKDATKHKLVSVLQEIDDLQNLLYAENKHSILIVLQGMDASGKDGLIRDVFSTVNPQGIQVKSFKEPTDEELSHDFLWRVHKHTPARGMIQVFNRSHYEDVLITRVEGMIDDKMAVKRMRSINDFERMLTAQNNTQILKFYLHVSKKEQLERLDERMKVREKMWKYNDDDIKTVDNREKYLRCYEDIFARCSEVPWHIVPADQNWYKSYIVATTLLKTLRKLDMQYPGMKKQKMK